MKITQAGRERSHGKGKESDTCQQIGNHLCSPFPPFLSSQPLPVRDKFMHDGTRREGTFVPSLVSLRLSFTLIYFSCLCIIASLHDTEGTMAATAGGEKKFQDIGKIDNWIERLMKCEYLSEAEILELCMKVRAS